MPLPTDWVQQVVQNAKAGSAADRPACDSGDQGMMLKSCLHYMTVVWMVERAASDPGMQQRPDYLGVMKKVASTKSKCEGRVEHFRATVGHERVEAAWHQHQQQMLAPMLPPQMVAPAPALPPPAALGPGEVRVVFEQPGPLGMGFAVPAQEGGEVSGSLFYTHVPRARTPRLFHSRPTLARGGSRACWHRG